MSRIPSPFLPRLALAAWIVAFAAAGCEHGESGNSFSWGDSSVPEETNNDDDDNAGNGTTPTGEASAFVGTWSLIPDAGGTGWYGFFNADGTWRICDNPDGSNQRVYGRYSVSNGRLEGDMTNPGVGNGAISATISPGGIMSFDFVEYWHEPHKTVTYSGSKL